MDIKLDIFNNVSNILEEIETAEQINALKLHPATLSLSSTASAAPNTAADSPTLAAFLTQRGRARGRGRAGITPTRRNLCKTCYEGDKGKSIYLSHNTEDPRCLTKLTLNAIIDEALPPEVIEAEEAEIEEEQVTQPNHTL